MRVKWAEIIERLKKARGLDEHLVVSERRTCRRVTQVLDLVGTRLDGRKVDLIATNFGVKGLKAESGARLRKAEELVVSRRPDDLGEGRKPHRARVQVIWSRRRRDYPVFQVGMQFVTETEGDRMAAGVFLLDDCGVVIQGEERGEVRRTIRVPAHFMPVHFTCEDGSMGEGRLENLSISGALLECHRRMNPKEIVHLRISLPDDVLPLVCTGTVVRAPWKNSVQRFQPGISFFDVAPDHAERLVRLLAMLIKES